MSSKNSRRSSTAYFENPEPFAEEQYCGLALIDDDAKDDWPEGAIWPKVPPGQGSAHDAFSDTTDVLSKSIGPTPAVVESELTGGSMIDAKDHARRSLRMLISARSREFNRLFDRMTKEFSPEEVIVSAIEEYRSNGKTEFLQTAASLMEAFGTRAKGVLWHLVSTGNAECFWFVAAAVNCPGLTDRSRSSVLVHLAIHPDRDVRLRSIDALDIVSPKNRKKVLAILSRDSDDEVREQAQEILRDSA